MAVAGRATPVVPPGWAAGWSEETVMGGLSHRATRSDLDPTRLADHPTRGCWLLQSSRAAGDFAADCARSAPGVDNAVGNHVPSRRCNAPHQSPARRSDQRIALAPRCENARSPVARAR